MFAWHAFLDSYRCLRHKRKHKSDCAGLKGIMRKHQILISLQQNHDMTWAVPRGREASSHTATFFIPTMQLPRPYCRAPGGFSRTWEMWNSASALWRMPAVTGSLFCHALDASQRNYWLSNAQYVDLTKEFEPMSWLQAFNCWIEADQYSALCRG